MENATDTTKRWKTGRFLTLFEMAWFLVMTFILAAILNQSPFPFNYICALAGASTHMWVNRVAARYWGVTPAPSKEDVEREVVKRILALKELVEERVRDGQPAPNPLSRVREAYLAASQTRQEEEVAIPANASVSESETFSDVDMLEVSDDASSDMLLTPSETEAETTPTNATPLSLANSIAEFKNRKAVLIAEEVGAEHKRKVAEFKLELAQLSYDYLTDTSEEQEALQKLHSAKDESAYREYIQDRRAVMLRIYDYQLEYLGMKLQMENARKEKEDSQEKDDDLLNIPE